MGAQFKKIFSYFISTSTFKHSAVTFIGTFVNGILGAIFYIIAARYLGPSNFGILGVTISVLTLCSDIGDFGVDSGIVNFIPRNRDNPQVANKYLKLGVLIKMSISVVIAIFGYILSSFIAEVMFTKPELIFPLRVAFLGVGSVLLFSFLTHSLQAYEKFWMWSFMQIFTNALRVIAIFSFAFFGIVSIGSVLGLYILFPFLGFLIGLYVLPKRFLFAKNILSVLKNFFHYNKWVALFSILTALSSRMDLFISARLLSATEIGYYSAANQLVKIIPQIVTAFGTVIAPKMANQKNITSLIAYFKKTQLLVVVLSVLGSLSVPVVIFLIPYIYGTEYLAVREVFVILFFAMVIFFLAVPIHMSILYYFSYPRFFFYMSVLQFFVITVFGFVFTSNFGLIGTSLVVLLSQILNLVVPGVWLYIKVRKEKK